ncbi:MAG: NlpC/P60 family protein [Patescibacteria group bacterium]|nr:NlpC/P60 family protein [Patescibacteria group bacterium]
MAISEDILKNVEKLYQQKYGIAVFDVRIKNNKNSIEIEGSVLTENQRNYIVNALKKNKIKVEKENLKVLGDMSERNEIGWAVVKSKIIDLRLRFVSNKIISDKILKRIRCSQAFQRDILRVLFKNEDQLLVQQNDLTLGWVDRKDVILKRASLFKKWSSGNFALKDKIIKAKVLSMGDTVRSRGKILKQVQNDNIDDGGDLQNKIVEEAKKFLNTKYVLGGKSKKGIDCSGLTQAVYKNSLNIILPRHSWDQKKIGKKINLKNVKSGDLIFLIKKSNQHKHVGIVEKNKSVNLIHASLDKKKVIKQSLEKVFENYDFVEMRRVVE